MLVETVGASTAPPENRYAYVVILCTHAVAVGMPSAPSSGASSRPVETSPCF